MSEEIKQKLKIGFAVMDPAVVREIGAMGGRAAHAVGKAHEWTSEEAREAGRKGGRASHAKKQVTKCNPTPDGGCDGDTNCMHAPTEVANSGVLTGRKENDDE